MPIAKFKMPDGRIARFEVPAGTTPEQAQMQASQMFQSGQLETPQAQQPTEQPTQAKDTQDQAPLDEIRKRLIENPATATLAELGSAVNRGAVNLLDFFGPKAINSALELAGVDARIPEIGETEIGKQATTGMFMEPGLAREMVRKGGEYVAPVSATGQIARTIAQAVPKTAIPTVTQRVAQSVAQPAATEAVGGALSGAGAAAGGEIGETVAGETGRQIGEFAGGVIAPIGASLAKQSTKSLVTTGAKKLLQETAPTIEGLKTAARKVYGEIDDLGVTLNSSGVNRLSDQLGKNVRSKGFNPTIHPKVNAALKEFETIKGTEQSLSNIDTLRRVAQSAAKSTEPDEARLGSLMVNRIDDFLDNVGKNDVSKFSKDIGAKYKDARQLWRRARKGEIIEKAFTKAGDQATGFENGIRTQFRAILNSDKKSKGFTKDEIEAMREVVRGTSLQNMAKMLGRFGFSEGQASNMLMGSLGVAGGAAAGGPAGAVAVPLIGQLSRSLAQKLTKKGAERADLIVRAGNNGIDVVKAYMKAIPAKQRNAKELTELLLRQDMSLEKLKSAISSAPKDQKKIISDAVFLVNAIKSQQQEEQ